MNLQHLQQRNKELTILNEIAQELNREMVIEKALNSTLRKTVELLGLKTGWIWFFQSENQTAYLAASYNLPNIFLEQPALLGGWCYCIDKYQKNDFDAALNISEITCTRLQNLSENTTDLRYHASVPLVSTGEKLGLLNVVSPELQRLSPEKLQLLYTIGDMLSIAIQRARLFENSHQMGILEERNRLAREIHDTLAQGLSGISLRLEALEVLLQTKASAEKVKNMVTQLLQLTKDHLREARQSVLDLRATPLKNKTLPEALEDLLKNLCKEGRLEMFFEIIGIYSGLSKSIEMGLFRIAQEALNNVKKHAQATEVNVQITYQTNQIILTIEDNGKGFDVDEEMKTGFGHIGMNERAQLLKGNLAISSNIGVGTKVRVVVPVN